MKKALLLLTFFVGLSFIASAQNCNVNFLGTKTLYKSQQLKYTHAPAGYKPVFINHVGRHGARHLTKDVKESSAFGLLIAADSTKALTEKGKRLRIMVTALQMVEKGKTKFISAEGAEELKAIGTRMRGNYPGVFKGIPNLSVSLTKEIRTKQSADAFLQGLKNGKDSLTVTEQNDDTGLRFYDASPAYKTFENAVDKGELMRSLDEAQFIKETENAITARFFTDEFCGKLSASAKAKFVADVFGFATIVYSLKAEIEQAGFNPRELDFKAFFTCDELAKLGMLDSIDENLKKGPATDNNGIQVRIAVPLLVEFINSTDEFIKTKKYDAQLRFAHAETIAPFAALLQIASADKAITQAALLYKAWQSSSVIPLSANIQWVFYKNPHEPGYLVKILLNEKEQHISGLSQKTFYYTWEDLRKLYITKLTKFNVKLTDDMSAYLTGLK